MSQTITNQLECNTLTITLTSKHILIERSLIFVRKGGDPYGERADVTKRGA